MQTLRPTRCRIATSATFLLVLTNVAWSQSESRETQQTVKMIRGLRQRSLFDLADQFASLELESEQIPQLEKATVLNELIRTKVIQAASLTATQREEVWTRAHFLADDFLKKSPEHPRRLLVQIQDALTFFAQGNLIGQEIAAEIQPSEKRTEALQYFRNANKLFAAVDKEIENQLPLARSQSPTEETLTTEQLVNLRNNVRYQMARVSLSRAEMYATNDKLNRIDALQQVYSRLDRLIRKNQFRRSTLVARSNFAHQVSSADESF